MEKERQRGFFSSRVQPSPTGPSPHLGLLFPQPSRAPPAKRYGGSAHSRRSRSEGSPSSPLHVVVHLPLPPERASTSTRPTWLEAPPSIYSPPLSRRTPLGFHFLPQFPLAAAGRSSPPLSCSAPPR